MSFDSHTAVTAVGLVSNALSSVKTALDLSKKTSDLELKQEIGSALDNILDLKVKVMELADENRSLMAQLDQKAAMVRTQTHGYYFVDGDPDPFCPKCWEESGKAIHLKGLENWNYGTRRYCRTCNTNFVETEGQPPRDNSPFGREYWS